MDDNRIVIDRVYRDPRGRTVQVIGWDRERNRVIFKRDGYEHECMLPVEQFRKGYTRQS